MNNDKYIENRIKELISKMTKVPIEKIDSNTILFEFGLSSLQFFECVAEIENIFDISFSERDLTEVYTVNDAVNKVLKKLNK